MKIEKKFLIVLAIIFIIFSIYLIPSSYAAAVINGDDWNSIAANVVNTTVPSTSATRFVVTVVRVLEVMVSGFCVICTSVIGIRYFFTASASEKYRERGSLFWSIIITILACGFDVVIELVINALIFNR